ncbi:MAG: hypothetical protein O3B84_06945 [Chloroflexi bacterium]|nr:hypothetical protein [Chloroflexota bacterium]
MSFLAEEFWWLRALGVELTDGWVGIATSRWIPPEEGVPPFDEEAEPIPIADLESWAARHNWENVHRSLNVEFRAHGVATSLVGPFIVDIDAEEEEHGNVQAEQVQQAAGVALRVVRRYYARGTPPDDIRVYDSGHKGFHVELVKRVRPEFHTEAGSQNEWPNEIRKLRAAILGADVGLAIDPPHSHVRLKCSWNCATERRRVARMTLEELQERANEVQQGRPRKLVGPRGLQKPKNST